MVPLFFCRAVLCLCWFSLIKSEERPLSNCEIERLLKPILSPPEESTIQAQALRQRLVNLLRQGLEEQVDNSLDEKRSIPWDDYAMKRNLQALARAGYIKTLPSDEDDDDNDSNFKRSLQYLARNGELPDMRREEPKRGIESLARNGELHHSRRNFEDLINDLYDKRNIGSLARDFNFPSYGKRFVGSLAKSGDLGRFEGKRNIASIVRNGKRSLSSLARSNNLPFEEYKRNIASLARDGKIMGKRNVAALLRQDNYLNEQHQHDDDDSQTDKSENEDELEESKRNLPSIKAGLKPKFKRSAPYVEMNVRRKRQADYYDVQNEEFPLPVYQNSNGVDYEELIHALTGAYPSTEKRFLGSVARSGWPSSLVKIRNPDKRHIGSLARLGWLPSFRAARRFNRSGRSTNVDCGLCREAAADGQAEDDPVAVAEGQEKEDKRFLLIPAVDNILLRKFPMRFRAR